MSAPTRTTDRPARRAAPGWMKLVLVLSLTANLVVVGFLIGHSLVEEEQGNSLDRQVGWMLRIVPEERREMAEAHFEAARPQLEAAQAERLDQSRHVISAVRAEPFDPAAVSAAMTGTLQSRSTQRTIVYDRFATLLGQLTPAERVAVADRMESWIARRSAEQSD